MGEKVMLFLVCEEIKLVANGTYFPAIVVGSLDPHHTHSAEREWPKLIALGGVSVRLSSAQLRHAGPNHSSRPSPGQPTLTVNLQFWTSE